MLNLMPDVFDAEVTYRLAQFEYLKEAIKKAGNFVTQKRYAKAARVMYRATWRADSAICVLDDMFPDVMLLQDNRKEIEQSAQMAVNLCVLTADMIMEKQRTINKKTKKSIELKNKARKALNSAKYMDKWFLGYRNEDNIRSRLDGLPTYYESTGRIITCW